ncbi:MAG: hypothetical protein JAY85_13715 [Candidatus Thiodiazotropha weberae]|uniref:Uncharacterized protein n=1 Tax=Candidatus Thiodiazotropha endoloripes TaxID=1818881 RepID=A0A1E2UPL0_9GAMM|nr:hypothetical protein [Candidatus Thiodiazotropha endoloripes]MCG7899500.1 hypothetical protein [Candidatus Thiodiazotropha weberae]ODB90044.1 hypothetical protein A3195_00615 [Candidatus Thiodiazotropha endoloripes]ODB92247.1 hypothetical protein A3194_07555 [Candidatus Thiodiazotropha endoloripes]ODB96693.1 hypothetical protein A3196_07940 [Candidatus Thiodiazotropha endoloripes]
MNQSIIEDQTNLWYAGLSLLVVEIMGRLATPANQIVKQFDEKFGSANNSSSWYFSSSAMKRAKRQPNRMLLISGKAGNDPSGIFSSRNQMVSHH